MSQTFELPSGAVFEAEVPPGHIASVITYLKRMRRPDGPRDCPAGYEPDWNNRPNASAYRDLFRQVGETWLWFSQLTASDAQIEARVHAETTDFCTLYRDGVAAGYIETARLPGGEVNVTFLGLVPGQEGSGLGGYLMEEGLYRAWQKGATFATVHTCTLDHPRALGFYKRCGFVPVRRAVEVAPDPRAAGLISPDVRPSDPVL